MAISHVNANDCEGLKNLITNIMESDGNKPIARAGMSAVSTLLDQEVNTFCAENGRPRLSQENLQTIPLFIIELIRKCPLKANFDESDFICRKAIFNYNCECGSYSEEPPFTAD